MCSQGYHFGDLPGTLIQGELYTRRDLIKLKAHQADVKGVSGNCWC